MATKTKNATKRQSERVLREVAKWMQTKGYGSVSLCGECAGCLASTGPTWGTCSNFKFGPVPTGPEAASNAEGPELIMDFDFLGHGPRPAIVLEGGPYDWAVECCYSVQEKLGKTVFVEPITGWALGIYPWSF